MVFNDANPAGPRSGQETSQRERGALTEDRFDTLTHRLATASMSRRDVIGVIGGVFAGAVASTSFGTQRASARPGQLPQQIYVIRHGEKPPESGPPFGVDVPNVAPKVGLRTPTALYATAYVDASVTKIHRPYQTILGLSGRIGLSIQSPDLIGQEGAFADAVRAGGGEVALICYEHDRIPALVRGLPTVDGTAVPVIWPDDRFDVIWTFSLDPATGRYVFGQVPEQLLDGDTDTVI
jgi:hypothetical protein